MQPSASPVLPWPTPLPLCPCPRPFPGGFCLLRRCSTLATPSSASAWASWRAGRRNGLRRAFPLLGVSRSTGNHEVGGADVVEPLRGGDELDEEDEEGEVGEGVGSEFIEVGYISSVHALRGEVRVKPSTDFPELRFLKPGRRWLRTRISGKEEVREVELMGGRSHPGQKTWILSFNGVDTVDQAKQIVGSTLLVKEGNRPKLEEGEFYTPDLFGMKVILKESGRQVGTVVDVVNYGASDLLQVMLNTTNGSFDGDGSSESKPSSSGPLVWVPFVEAIVPDVDIDNREMHITPPKGLLELNIRSDTRSKKERRQMKWKETKKLRQRVTSVKKKLSEIGQEHVLRGLSYGEKNQRRLLAEQIGDINLRLFQLAMENINKCFERTSFPGLLSVKSIIPMENCLQISHACYNTFTCKEEKEDHHALLTKGHHLISESKVAIILMLDYKDSWESVSSLSEESTPAVMKLKNVLYNYSRYVEINEYGASLPLIILSPTHELLLCQELLSDHDYFGFDNEKVWLLEEEKLPVVNIIPNDQNRHKILLRSPWEMIQMPIGPAGIFYSLLSHKIVESLNEIGIEYVQICSLGENCTPAHPLFLGWISSRETDVGIKISTGMCKEEIDVIFAMRCLSKVTKQVDQLQFYAVPEQNKHVELVDNEWVDIEPSEPNSYRLYCPIYELLNSDNISVLSVED
uniref:Ribosome maturation factor RimM n=2 Tax=Anthurium amnicola TaxID=1678845 RepID=A0A1D1YP83_9ARAE